MGSREWVPTGLEQLFEKAFSRLNSMPGFWEGIKTWATGMTKQEREIHALEEKLWYLQRMAEWNREIGNRYFSKMDIQALRNDTATLKKQISDLRRLLPRESKMLSRSWVYEPGMDAQHEMLLHARYLRDLLYANQRNPSFPSMQVAVMLRFLEDQYGMRYRDSPYGGNIYYVDAWSPTRRTWVSSSWMPPYMGQSQPSRWGPSPGPAVPINGGGGSGWGPPPGPAVPIIPAPPQPSGWGPPPGPAVPISDGGGGWGPPPGPAMPIVTGGWGPPPSGDAVPSGFGPPPSGFSSRSPMPKRDPRTGRFVRRASSAKYRPRRMTEYRSVSRSPQRFRRARNLSPR